MYSSTIKKQNLSNFKQQNSKNNTIKGTLFALIAGTLWGLSGICAQFLFQNNKTELDSNNMKLIERWVQLSILARVFGAQTTSYLTQLRKEIKNTEIFPSGGIKQLHDLSGHFILITKMHKGKTANRQ